MRFLPSVCVLTFGLHAGHGAAAETKEGAYPALERFVNVMEMAKARHPDLEKLSYDQLINHALDGMLSSLDPHSSFIHPEMKEAIGTVGTLNHEIRSLGLSLGKNAESLHLIAVEKGGPADLSGLKPGMEVLKIKQQEISAIPLRTALEWLTGQAGETVEMSLRDHTKASPATFTLTHRFVEQRSLIISKLLEHHPGVGYLRLAEFGGACAREVEAALDELEDKGMKSLILDLRENGGGDLHETVRIIGLFTPPATPVVSVRERDKPEEFLKTPDRQRRQRLYPMSVLIDRHSASASELTAGALHDLKRAKIIGERSYGKGSVQQIIPMGGSTALRLTIATYHTPSGNTPHMKGITPDIVIPFSDADREYFLKSARIASLTPAERETLSTWADPAITAALDAMK